jgi:hypothetical protein
MCNVAYLQMAQVAVGAYGQSQQASAVRKNARQAESDSLWALHDQQIQSNAAATDQMTARARAAMAEAGTFNAIFADSGLSGNTQERISAVAAGQANEDIGTIERNRQNRVNQGNNDVAAVRARTQSAINGSPAPSLIGTGLQIAALSANEYNRQNPKKTGT